MQSLALIFFVLLFNREGNTHTHTHTHTRNSLPKDQADAYVHPQMHTHVHAHTLREGATDLEGGVRVVSPPWMQETQTFHLESKPREEEEELFLLSSSSWRNSPHGLP